MLVNKPLNLELLQEQFVAANIPVPSGLQLAPPELYIVETDGTLAEPPPSAQPIIDSHDPTQMTQAQQSLQATRTQCRTFYQQTNTAWAALTAAQKADTLRDTLRALIYAVARQDT